MDVIRGGMRGKRGRWPWRPRPRLQLVTDAPSPGRLGAAEDPYLYWMIGALGLFVVAFALFMGAWTGG